MTSIKTFQIISEYGKYKHLKRIPVYPQPGKLDFNIKKKRATKKFDYGRQAQSKLQLSWTGLLYPQLIHHISISNLPDKQWLPHLINNGILPDNQWQPRKVTQYDLVNYR